jgi:hypothetical protein
MGKETEKLVRCGLVRTRSTHSARTRPAYMESNVVLASGSAMIKMLSDQFLRNLLQPAPNVVVLCKNYQTQVLTYDLRPKCGSFM